MSDWDAERAYELAVQTLNFLERTYPRGASLEPLEPYRRAVLEAQDLGDFEAFKESLRQKMFEGKRVARAAGEARQNRGAA